MAKFKPGDRVMRAGEWAVYTVHEAIAGPDAEISYSLQTDTDLITTAKESELEAEPALRTAIRGTSKGRKVGKLPRARKPKVTKVHNTRRRRALKRDHNPKSKGTERKRIRGK